MYHHHHFPYNHHHNNVSAPWKTSFDRAETLESEFNAPSGSVRTQYMSSKLKVRVLNDDVNQVHCLPSPSLSSFLSMTATSSDEI